MLTTVEGTYRDGKVELNEQPAVRDGSRVIVTFLSPEVQKGPGEMIRFGMLRSEGGQESTWEDFQAAKHAFHKRLEDDNAD
jgi:hypothetical protein